MNREDILLDIAQTLKCTIDEIPGDLADKELNRILGLATGTVQVKRCRGDLNIPSYKVGRCRRTPLSEVIAFKLGQIKTQHDEMEAAA